MANKKTHDVVATTGEYTDRAGEKKKRYLTVGAAFTDDQGRISLKLEAVPVGPDWSGWLSLYPADKDKERGGRQQGQRSQPARPETPSFMDDSADDQPPF